jgi:hypothetical protein
MVFKSNKDSECFDCKKAYKEGDELEPNGHKTKAGKDYFCPDGKNCQGTMHLKTPSTTEKRMVLTDDPTVAQLRANYNLYMDTHPNAGTTPYLMIEDYIIQREACEEIGITNPITIGMIWNNRVRDRQ